MHFGWFEFAPRSQPGLAWQSLEASSNIFGARSQDQLLHSSFRTSAGPAVQSSGKSGLETAHRRMGWGRQGTRELDSRFACRLRAGRGRNGIPKIRRLLDLCRKACHGVPLRLHVFGSHVGQVHVLELTLMRRIGAAAIDRSPHIGELFFQGMARCRLGKLGTCSRGKEHRRCRQRAFGPDRRFGPDLLYIAAARGPRMAAVPLSDRGWPLKRMAIASTENNNSNVMTLYLESGLFFVVFTQPLCDHTRTNR